MKGWIEGTVGRIGGSKSGEGDDWDVVDSVPTDSEFDDADEDDAAERMAGAADELKEGEVIEDEGESLLREFVREWVRRA